MAYTLADITELIHYHLVLAERDYARANQNLGQPIRNIVQLATEPTTIECGWVAATPVALGWHRADWPRQSGIR